MGKVHRLHQQTHMAYNGLIKHLRNLLSGRHLFKVVLVMGRERTPGILNACISYCADVALGVVLLLAHLPRPFRAWCGEDFAEFAEVPEGFLLG